MFLACIHSTPQSTCLWPRHAGRLTSRVLSAAKFCSCSKATAPCCHTLSRPSVPSPCRVAVRCGTTSRALSAAKFCSCLYGNGGMRALSLGSAPSPCHRVERFKAHKARATRATIASTGAPGTLVRCIDSLFPGHDRWSNDRQNGANRHS
jgi:hypothetical protein